MNLTLGYKASNEQFGPANCSSSSQHAETRGFEAAGVSDHLQPWRHNGGHAPGVLPWLGAAAATTSTIVLGTSVLTPTMRYHPAIIAQAFATLGCLAPGRIFLGVGTGEAMNETPITGGEFPGRKERRLKMAEAIKVIKLLWSEERVDFEGEYYKLRRATIYDRPDQPVPIYVAASGPLAAKLAGRVGDGFICTSGKDPQLYVDLLDNVSEGAEKAGRDYESIKRMIEVKVSYDADLEVAREGHALVGRARADARGEGRRRGPGRDGAPGRHRDRPRAHALHRLRRPAGGRGQDPALHRPRLQRAGHPLPRQRSERYIDEFASDIFPLLQ